MRTIAILYEGHAWMSPYSRALGKTRAPCELTRRGTRVAAMP
jgi:hypothetical protein